MLRMDGLVQLQMVVHVHDEASQSDGILDSKREVSPEQACNDSTICCKLAEGEVRLKKNHPYYHQVQLQLYVGYDCFKWCDFCIFTCKGLSVQRIFPYTKLQEDEIPVLEHFLMTSCYRKSWYLTNINQDITFKILNFKDTLTMITKEINNPSMHSVLKIDY